VTSADLAMSVIPPCRAADPRERIASPAVR
jgi:hypothetical protein